MAETPTGITQLIEKFEQNLESYRNPAYGEAQVRIEFINPLFEALGWDVANKAGHAEAYKDVIHEDAVKVGGATKAPDYSFRMTDQLIFLRMCEDRGIKLHGQLQAFL